MWVSKIETDPSYEVYDIIPFFYCEILKLSKTYQPCGSITLSINSIFIARGYNIYVRLYESVDLKVD